MSHFFSYPRELCQCLLQPAEFLLHGVHGDGDSSLISSCACVSLNYKREGWGERGGRREGKEGWREGGREDGMKGREAGRMERGKIERKGRRDRGREGGREGGKGWREGGMKGSEGGRDGWREGRRKGRDGEREGVRMEANQFYNNDRGSPFRLHLTKVFSPLDLIDVLCHLADGVPGVVYGRVVGMFQ